MREKLLGKDLRSISEANTVAESITTQESFDELFAFLSEDNRLLQMRTIDAVEKITVKYPEFLVSHKKAVMNLCATADNKEFKWHLALLLPRLPLNSGELSDAWLILKKWALDSKESRILRTNALQSLYDLAQKNHLLQEAFQQIVQTVQTENIPSLNARIRKLNPLK